MREDALEVLARNKTDLLKSISHNIDFGEEAGHYLLSVENIMRSDINYELDNEDILCLKAVSDVLRKRKLSPDKLIEHLESTEPDFERVTPSRDEVEEVKEGARGRDFRRNISRMLPQFLTNNDFTGRMTGGHDIGMAHGQWPGAKPNKDSHYSNHHPFHEDIHPLRMKNVTTGRPQYESMLFEKYFGHDATPWWKDDFHENMNDTPESESFAKQAKKIENTHEKYHRKIGSPIYEGVDRGFGDKSYSFLGGPTTKDVDNPYDHMEDTRIHDYERWKTEEGTNLSDYKNKFSGLSDERKERAMQVQHFKDRMDKMSKGDTSTTVVDPTENMSEQEKADFRTQNPEQAEPYRVKHAHSMGWNTLMKGLYFLKPQDRTKILQHIRDHGSDDYNKQLVRLSDGKDFPMTRLKKNMEMSAGPEAHWFSRSQSSSSPNVHKTIETDDDSKFTGEEGGVLSALKSTFVDDKDEVSAYDRLLGNLNQALNINVDNPDDAILLPRLFQHNKVQQKKLKNHLETSDSAAKGFNSYMNRSQESLLSKEGLLSLAGYDSSRVPVDNHPTIPDELYSGALLDRTTIDKVMNNLGQKSSLSKQSKQIKNAYGTFRTGFNGPRVADIAEEEKKHYISEDGKLRGLGSLMTKYFSAHGGLGRDPTTYGEFLHEHHKSDGEEEDSLLGNYRYDTKDESIMGEMMNEMNARKDTVGMFGGIHISPLLDGLRGPLTPLQILTRYGVSRKDMDNKEENRSRHNNYTDELSTHFPELLSSLHNKTPSEETHFLDRKFNRETSSNYMQDHPYAGIGAEFRGDSSLLNRSAMSHRLALALGRNNPPNQPPDNNVLGYSDIANDPMLGPRPNNHTDLLQFLGDARKNISDTGEIRFSSDMDPIERRDIISEMMNIQERIQEIEMNPDIPNRDVQLAILRGDVEQLKRKDDDYREKQLQDSQGLHHSKEFTEKKNADMIAHAEYAKSKLLPKILEEDPNAFSTSNPAKALSNAMRLAYDANRGMMVDGDHSYTTMGYHEKEETRDSLEQALESKGQESPHKKLAMSLRDKGVKLNPQMKVEEAREILGLPDDEYHNQQVEQILGTLVGPTKAATFSQVMSMGDELHPRMDNMFSEFKGIGDIKEHIDGFGDVPARNLKGSKAFNTSNKAYRTLGFLRQLPRLGDMTAYGLNHHSHPESPPKDINSTTKERARNKALSSHIFTFDEGQSGPLEEASAGSITKPVHGKMTVPIRPVQEMSGNVITPMFNSGRMDYGYSMSPSVGFDFGSQGAPTVGTNMPNTQLLNTVPRPWMESVFGQEWANQLYSHPELSTQLGTLTNNQMSLNQSTGQAPVDDLSNVGKMLKAALPKEVPLIDPLHRIFEVDDMEQLRGFTGEWVISKYHEGKRVKVKKKGNRIDITNEGGEKIGVDDEMRVALRKVCERDYVIDATIVGDDLHVNDILLYEETDVTDLTTRERVKLIRGQFDSYEPVHVPSPESIRVTDEVGFEEAVKELGKGGQKLLLRDAMSTYMKGEERHPKWVLLAKSEEDIHIPFAMEIDRGHFIIHLPEDLVKYEIVDEQPINPIAAIGSISNSDYSLKLAKSLEPYWRQGFKELLKEELDREDWDEDNADEGMTDERAHRIEGQSAGLLKPKKDKNILLKPEEALKALLIMEKALGEIEKGHFPMSGGKGLGIDVGGAVESPRGPTSLTTEHAIPDWDMKERPEQDPEKPSDYPNKPKKKKEKEEQYDDLGE